MDWLNELAMNRDFPLLAAFALGLLTAISPCPLATNITATAYIAKTLSSRKKVLLSGFLYTLGRMISYTTLAAFIYFGASKFQIAKLFQANGEKFIGPVMILIGLVVFMADFGLSLGPVVWLYIPEILEPDLIPFSTGANWGAATLITILFPILKSAFGTPAPLFLFYAAYCLLGFLFSQKYVIETKGKSEKEIYDEYEKLTQ